MESAALGSGPLMMNQLLELHRLSETEIELLNSFRKAGPNAKFIVSFAKAAAGEVLPSNVVPIRSDIEAAV